MSYSSPQVKSDIGPSQYQMWCSKVNYYLWFNNKNEVKLQPPTLTSTLKYATLRNCTIQSKTDIKDSLRIKHKLFIYEVIKPIQ